ncbi:MAG TPA: RNA-directed DNA polymerase [Thermodesulfobacteriota bacterium]|nr:RNA-directed DNA polymerase [Thermodesulfobacteriota bacterium]
MKRCGSLFNQIASFENLYLASRKARKGKRLKDNVLKFEKNIEDEIFILQEELISKTYIPGKYREFAIYERKPRKISAAPYRDRVVHHALCNIIEPIFEKTFIFDSYACRKDKGTHKAVDRFTEFCRKNRYVFKGDIKKYFPSIDHEILFEKIQRKIKCKDTLSLIKTIITYSNQQEEVIDYFKGDDLLEPFRRKRGIPIGNLTSQFFANIYLNDLDHYVKEALKCRYYIRYVDDIAIFDDSKERLWDIKGAIEECLEKDRLKLHPKKCMIFPVSTGADMLGYRVFPSYRLLRKDNSMRFIRKLKNMSRLYREGILGWKDINPSVQSWLGHARHADTYGLRRDIFGKILFQRNVQSLHSHAKCGNDSKCLFRKR